MHLFFLLAGCATPAAPYHTARCGDVTAVWSGASEPEAPKSYGVTGLSFVDGSGRARPFEPTGDLYFVDWSFDIFSPDCSRVAVLQSHWGPFTVFATADVVAGANPVTVQVDGATASVLGQWRWTGSSTFEFVASCCGGARVYAGDVAAPGALDLVYEASSAPSGVELAPGPSGPRWVTR